MATSPPESLGRYEMVSRLGRGGMAETWRARLVGAEGVTKPVLIKRVLPEFANDQTFISMFISEARISATLSHGNIAQVFDFGRADNEYFLAMEFVDGQPLNRLIKRALKSGLPGIPVPLATFIALEMCRGLHYAHTRKDDKGTLLGIVHRDISPDNVLVSYEGQVKIVDFGIAKARELHGVHTEPGVVKGKYLFFSPEQARGEEVDARTDVWATGVVLYEMLCGQMPVKGPQYMAQMKLAEGHFPRPRELRPELPAELDDIVMRALAVDVHQRFESAHAFGDALTGFLYSTTPRFSSLSVSHLVQELFRTDLSSEGREVQVPSSFLEELTLLRTPGKPQARAVSAPPVRTRVRPSTPPVAALAPEEDDLTEEYLDTPPESPEVTSVHERRTGPRLAVGIGVLVVLLGAIFLFSQAWMKIPETSPALAPPPPMVASPAPLTDTRPNDSRSESTEQLSIKAELLIENHAFPKAISFLEECIDKDPTYARCHLLMGAAQSGVQNIEQGTRHYRRFLELVSPDDPEVPRVKRLLEESETRKSPNAFAPPRQSTPGTASRADPRLAAQYAEEGATLIKQQHFEEAERVLKTCIEADPNASRCYLLWGVTSARLMRLDEGARAYRRFLELAPPTDPNVPRVKRLLEDYDRSRHPGGG